jgi:hypothetical protein
MKKFNLFYQNVKLNKVPLTEKEADYEIGLIIINYGYKPAKIQIHE